VIANEFSSMEAAAWWLSCGAAMLFVFWLARRV